MTASYDVPQHVAASIARREAARARVLRCAYGCHTAARLYPGGAFCDEHSPWAAAGQPNPDTQVDPSRTLTAIRTAAGLRADATFSPSHTILDQRAIDSGRRASGARRRASHEDSIDTRFLAFHTHNPHVYGRVVELVADAILRGEKRIGVGALFEQLRYSERTETNGDRYRLNNDFRAPLVRLLLEEHPEFADLFELRQRKAS